jgi:aerobic-type carbon monoxide dehydrogenase small subunit (CoxS/CutS family)
MSGWTEGACACGAFILVPEGEDRELCTSCAARAREAERRATAAAEALAADPLRCDKCETVMLEPAADGLCGICKPASVFQRACWAMDAERAA